MSALEVRSSISVSQMALLLTLKREKEAGRIINSIDITCIRSKMEISPDKMKTISNNTDARTSSWSWFLLSMRDEDKR